MSTTPAILTGSQAYGSPTDESDVDLVVFADEQTMYRLWGLSERNPDQKPSDNNGEWDHSISMRFGGLNLIVTCSYHVYEAWREGTQQLIGEADQIDNWNSFLVGAVTRSRAIEVLEPLRQKAFQIEQVTSALRKPAT